VIANITTSTVAKPTALKYDLPKIKQSPLRKTHLAIPLSLNLDVLAKGRERSAYRCLGLFWAEVFFSQLTATIMKQGRLPGPRNDAAG
jgi:hypothetical protein